MMAVPTATRDRNAERRTPCATITQVLSEHLMCQSRHWPRAGGLCRYVVRRCALAQQESATRYRGRWGARSQASFVRLRVKVLRRCPMSTLRVPHGCHQRRRSQTHRGVRLRRNQCREMLPAAAACACGFSRSRYDGRHGPLSRQESSPVPPPPRNPLPRRTAGRSRGTFSPHLARGGDRTCRRPPAGRW